MAVSGHTKLGGMARLWLAWDGLSLVTDHDGSGRSDRAVITWR
jgi:hypothetical protein